MQNFREAQLSEELGALAVPIDAHSFYNPQNYGWHEGTIKLRDYGGESISEVLLSNREKFAYTLEVLREEHSGLKNHGVVA